MKVATIFQDTVADCKVQRSAALLPMLFPTVRKRLFQAFQIGVGLDLCHPQVIATSVPFAHDHFGDSVLVVPTLIRVNPREGETPMGGISLPIGAREAISRLHARLNG